MDTITSASPSTPQIHVQPDGTFPPPMLQILGILLILVAAANLLVLPFLDAFSDPTSAVVRYTLALPAGVGLFLLRRWGAALYAGMLVFVWGMFFSTYEHLSPLPITGCVLIFQTALLFVIAASWRQLR